VKLFGKSVRISRYSVARRTRRVVDRERATTEKIGGTEKCAQTKRVIAGVMHFVVAAGNDSRPRPKNKCGPVRFVIDEIEHDRRSSTRATLIT